MSHARAVKSAITAALLGGFAISGGVTAQEASPVAGGGPALPTPPANCVVVADGLWAPRFVAVGDDGSVYVTEVGVGGGEALNLDEPGAGTNEETASPVPQTEATPATEDDAGVPPATRGYTGQVTKIAPDGTQSVLVSDLPSYSDGVGPAGIVFADGMLYVAVGGAGDGAGIQPLPEENTIYQIDPTTGDKSIIAQLGPYEVANNPDGTDVNPNLYDLTYVGDKLYVNDAGGNAIYEVDPTSGEFSLFAVVPGLAQLTGASAENDRQPVPTGITPAPGGGLFISLLSEEWPADAPSILHLSMDGTFSEAAAGLVAVVDVNVGSDGAIYATQLTTDFTSDAAPGNVVVIDETGSAIPVVEGLVLPHGTAWGADGSLYVTTVSINIAAEPLGALLSCAMGGGAMATPTS
jgi:hypothetical protein